MSRRAASITGIDNLSLDQRKFDTSDEDIQGICRFFSLGTLRSYEKEKNIRISHSNFFVFCETARGAYALKFYPVHASKTITTEYTVNRFLLGHRFTTPLMRKGQDGPCVKSNGHLATCYDYIEGVPAWKRIQQQSTTNQINASLLMLKKILSAAAIKGISFPKQGSLTTTISSLTRHSRTLGPYDQKSKIDASLLAALRAYQQHRSLFTRQKIHNNANLSNFLICKKDLYTLDLSHVQEDYLLSDLASLVISCFFFDVPAATISTIIKDYFTRHQLKEEYSSVLNTLVKVGLINEYLKNIQREGFVELKPYLSQRKKTILKLIDQL